MNKIMMLPKELTTVTPLSKFLAVILFITLPFAGFLLGMKYQQITSPPSIITNYPTPVVDETVSPAPNGDRANWKTYRNNEFSFSFQYPSNLKFTESKQLSISNYKDMVTSIGLSISKSSGFSLTLEPNPKSLTVDQWLLERIEEERVSCEIDCPGFSNPTQKLIIAKRNAIIQNLGSVVPSTNIYLPVGKNIVLWASAVNIRNQFPTEEDKNLLISILNTLQDNINNK